MTRPRGRAQRSAPGRGGPRRSAGSVLPAVAPVAERLAAAHGLAVWEVAFRREAGRETLRIAADREGGIDADGLARFAEELSRELDERDAIPGEQSYILEVTSPGAERRLRGREQFAICRGRPARVSLKDGRPPVEGVIGDVTDDAVTIVAGDDAIVVRYADVAQARLMIPEKR